MPTDITNIEGDPSKLIFADLSYKLIGAAFTVYNELGYGHLEKIYQRAFAKELQLQQVAFKEQVPYKVFYKSEYVGTGYLDFLVEDKVIVELKKSDYFSQKNIDQVVNYLKISDLQRLFCSTSQKMAYCTNAW